MCGIVSIFHYNSSQTVDHEELRLIRDYMTPRGPDGYGESYSPDNRVGMGHRRLAIIDLSETGAQPMTNDNKSLVIVFNGEIYNYRDLRADLKAKGYCFRSTSDTEVLLHLYDAKGPKMLHDLRGMFAFVIWDNSKKELFLARDPFGIKPLYYADDGKTIRVASQVKALLKGNDINTNPEPAGHVGFFLWGHVPEPYTLYKGIRALPAGTGLKIDATGRKETRRFFNISDELAKASEKPPTLTREEMRERLRAGLLDSVRHHLIADVPVGIFLSSGLDSTTLAALAKEVGTNDLRTVTLGFKEFQGTHNDEVPLAELVAQHYGAMHQTRWVAKEDFQGEYQRLMDAMDQPSIDGVNSYFVSKAAADAGLKVALSGLGGDELFGSYPSFTQVPKMVRFFGPFQKAPYLGKAFRMVSAPFLRHMTSPKYAGLLEYGGSFSGAYLLRRGMYMPWELPKLLDGEMLKEGWQELQTLLRLDETINGLRSDHLRVSALETCWYMRNQLLRDADWASMAHSIEMRVPLVDVHLTKTVAQLLCNPAPPDKMDMAAAPRIPLPREVTQKEKTGFSIPVHEWLQADAKEDRSRGLRGWALKVGKTNDIKNMRILVLLTDAFGGYGGIAKFNRDLLTAFCAYPECKEVVAIPRVMRSVPEEMPQNLRFITHAIDSKIKYVATVNKILSEGAKFDLIICGHIKLLPLAYYCHKKSRAPLGLIIYGIDAWQPTKNLLANKLVNKIDYFISISEFTKKKFLKWTKMDASKGYILPCCVDISRFGPGPKKPDLLRRYGLEGKKVLMTLGRLASRERYKGFDEVLDVLPKLAVDIPNIAYLIVGDGDDRKRLEDKAEALGVADKAVFAGFIPEEEKADHYRLADVYVMPSRGEGFGIVFLEAMACGIPVIGSTADGSQEALRGGALGFIVDPNQSTALINAIRESLLEMEKKIPEGLGFFSFQQFQERLHVLIQIENTRLHKTCRN